MDILTGYCALLAGAFILCGFSLAVFFSKRGKKQLAVLWFLLGSLLAGAARVFVVMLAVDSKTGFSRKGPVPTAYYLVICAMLAAIALLWFMKNKTAQLNTINIKFLEWISYLCAAAAFALVAFYSWNKLYVDGKASGLALITMFAAILSAAAMIYGLPAFSGKHVKASSIAFLAPALCVSFVLIKSFIDHIMVASVSEYLFDVAMFIFVMLMLFGDARVRAGYSAAAELKCFSLCSVLLICVTCLPKLIFEFNPSQTVFTEGFSVLYAAFLLLLPFSALRALQTKYE